MDNQPTPMYLMQLIDKLEPAIWKAFPTSKYRNVQYYIEKWHQTDDSSYDYRENFQIHKRNDGNIDLLPTLHGMDGELLLKIAIDMGIETPDFIPSIPTFKNDLKENYKTAFEFFEKALKQIEENPDLAIGLANSTLESIIKHILQDKRISIKLDKKKTLYNLTQDILKSFEMFPRKEETQNEVKAIGSSLLNIAQNIEALRSNKTTFHGKTAQDHVIDDPMYAYFVVNAISTVALFLLSFYKKKYSSEEKKKQEYTEIRSEDLPF